MWGPGSNSDSEALIQHLSQAFHVLVHGIRCKTLEGTTHTVMHKAAFFGAVPCRLHIGSCQPSTLIPLNA